MVKESTSYTWFDINNYYIFYNVVSFAPIETYL